MASAQPGEFGLATSEKTRSIAAPTVGASCAVHEIENSAVSRTRRARMGPHESERHCMQARPRRQTDCLDHRTMPVMGTKISSNRVPSSQFTATDKYPQCFLFLR